jgi:hypothetical protein
MKSQVQSLVILLVGSFSFPANAGEEVVSGIKVLSFDEQLESLRSECTPGDSPASPLIQRAYLSHLGARTATEPLQGKAKPDPSEKAGKVAQVEVRMMPTRETQLEPLKFDWLLGDSGGGTHHENGMINRSGDAPMKRQSK